MQNLIKTFEGRTCPEVWLDAVKFLRAQQNHFAYNVVLGVETPHVLSPADFAVHDLVDSFLREHDCAPLNTIASTIFPAGYYLQSGAKGVFTEYAEAYPKIHGGWGTYAYRMLRKSTASKTGNKEDYINPLEKIVDKIKSQLQGGHFRAIYEINLVEEDDLLELPTYDAAFDCDRNRPHPCLSHLSFKLTPDRKVMLTALYRYHYYVQKALGNLFGLAQLLLFVAQQTGLDAGPLICHSTYAVLDIEPKKWNLHKLDDLIQKSNQAYDSAKSHVPVPA
ncbi:MAG: hypothetical protein ABSD53_18460 [Terriglobales bacterium]|jgi:hypothetical protein